MRLKPQQRQVGKDSFLLVTPKMWFSVLTMTKVTMTFGDIAMILNLL